MKLQIRTNFSFARGLKYLESESFTTQKNKILGSHVVDASKRYIMQGKVKPALHNETIKRRMIEGINTNTPLFRTGNLANSLTATKKGIEGASYGKKHLEGIPGKLPKRNFIVMEEKRLTKPLNTLVKNINKALKK